MNTWEPIGLDRLRRITELSILRVAAAGRRIYTKPHPEYEPGSGYYIYRYDEAATPVEDECDGGDVTEEVIDLVGDGFLWPLPNRDVVITDKGRAYLQEQSHG